MEELNQDSKAFQRIMHNLRLEGMSLSPALEEKVLEIVNSGVPITSELILKLLKADEKC